MFKRNLGLIAALAISALAFALPVQAADWSIDGNLRGNCGTVASTGNGSADTATLNNKCGVVTTESLTNPASSEFTLTLTNSTAALGDLTMVSVGNGTNTTGLASLERVTTTANTIVVVVRTMTSAAYNGTLLIKYFNIKQ